MKDANPRARSQGSGPSFSARSSRQGVSAGRRRVPAAFSTAPSEAGQNLKAAEPGLGSLQASERPTPRKSLPADVQLRGLDAQHLSSDRCNMEVVMSMLQPWTERGYSCDRNDSILL